VTVSTTPLVSIAMCTYNGEHFLREQMDSLIAQDYPNLEIIITDDCSTDCTVKILREYEKKHSHITVIQNEKNLGFKKNFEKAISLCSGKYIALCDQDDVWFPNKIGELARNIGNNGLIYSNVQLINESGEKINKEFPRSNRLTGKCHMSLLFANCITGHASLITKEVMNEALPIPKGVKLHDHWIALVAAAFKGIKAYPETLSFYRQHQNNAVLRSREKKQRTKKTARRKCSFQSRMDFLEAAANCESLSKNERALVSKICTAYSYYPRCYTNKRFKKILNENKNTLLAIYKNPQKSMDKLCKGFFRDLL
jgi:glycosyltransferase involved in cell wall biosynthesis